MKHGSKIAIAAVLVLGVLAVVTEMVAAQVVSTRPSWENVEGVWDMSNLPANENVIDHTGVVVGIVETRHYGTGLYPRPVIGPDGNLVGHIGENGFWALGEPEPVTEGAYTIIEEFDASGGLISSQTIYESD